MAAMRNKVTAERDQNAALSNLTVRLIKIWGFNFVTYSHFFFTVTISQREFRDRRVRPRTVDVNVLKTVVLPPSVRKSGQQKGFGQTVVGTSSKKKTIAVASQRILRSRKGLKEQTQELQKLSRERKADKSGKKSKE